MSDVTPTVVFEDPSLLIGHTPGEGSRLVVAFTGIGHGLGRIQNEEFAGTASQAKLNHVAFVTDRKRSWYSTDGIQNRIVSELSRLIESQRISEVVCLGNSMGGHGSLLFARRLKAKTSIAFVPQYSMDPSVVIEPRWGQFRGFIHTEGLGDLGEEISSDVENHIVYGDKDSTDVDLDHFSLMMKNGRSNIYLVRAVGHNVAAQLKKRGILTAMISAMIASDQTAILAALGRTLTNRYLARPEK